MKKAIIISAWIIVIIVITSIVVSIINLRPAEFKTIVSYDADIKTMVEAPQYSKSKTTDSLPLLTNILKYEKTITVSSIIIVLIFVMLFYGAKRSKN
jgi:phosphatidylglycerophosphate synthase